MNQCRPFALVALILGGLTACSTIHPEPGSDRVVEISKQKAKSCQRLGLANTSTVDKVAFYERDQEAVMLDLVTLAKNEAVKMGGNAIVMEGQPQFGNASFVVFKC
ncbi:hypothetical protein HMF8227_01922 [Saliniradius amylolyticus]|uniref:DUF4156 domain-containing protein n=1 Tax=Saliniradius amylolyticus TaxID=2183582 RepID=A0A2S2E4F2_9ALTE|nr:DUF4156 domain-containing protein [Saliniradius amylolyticus]AWL12392.1 hypothetical protein HMF8227_01922 [Saliniradius amylolyticus]